MHAIVVHAGREMVEYGVQGRRRRGRGLCGRGAGAPASRASGLRAGRGDLQRRCGPAALGGVPGVRRRDRPGVHRARRSRARDLRRGVPRRSAYRRARRRARPARRGRHGDRPVRRLPSVGPRGLRGVVQRAAHLARAFEDPRIRSARTVLRGHRRCRRTPSCRRGGPGGVRRLLSHGDLPRCRPRLADGMVPRRRPDRRRRGLRRHRRGQGRQRAHAFLLGR